MQNEQHLNVPKGVVGLTMCYPLTKTSFISVTSSHFSLCALLGKIILIVNYAIGPYDRPRILMAL